MKKRMFQKGKKTKYWTIGIGILITAALLFVCAVLTKKGILREESQGLYASGIRLVSIFLVSVFAYKSMEPKNPLIYILVPILFYFVLLVLNLLIFGGDYPSISGGSLSIVLGALAAIIWDLKTKSRKVPGKKHFR